jgi:hypothetical protein
MIGSAAAVGGHVRQALVQVAARRCTMKRTPAINNLTLHVLMLDCFSYLHSSDSARRDAIKRNHCGLICAICFARRVRGLLGTV